jgi:ribonuclease HI
LREDTILSAELKAIKIATNFIFQQDEQRAVIITDSRTACQILMKAMKEDRHKKIAMRILEGIQKQMTIKWIPAHVGLEGNERADILAKDGARNGSPIDYSLKLKDAFRILEETQQLVRAEGGGEGEGLLQDGAERDSAR